jgi:lysozyme
MNDQHGNNTDSNKTEPQTDLPPSTEGDRPYHSHHGHISGHHHHRRHHSYEEHLKRKAKAKRRKRWKKVRTAALAILLTLALLLVIIALFAPNLLQRFASPEKDLGKGVTYLQTGNPHLRLDYDGIDVSRHQGIIDWQRVAEDTCVQFVYIKATEGRTLIDKNYLQNVAGARKAGIPSGSYHYMTSQSSAVDQFRNFYGVVDRRLQDIIPMIDIEEEGVKGWSRQEIQDSLARMIQLIEQHYHCTPIIYTYTKFYNENLAPRFNSYQLFLARYNIYEPVVSGAGNHNIWQHSDQGIIDGINTPVDLDVFAEDTTLDDIKMPRKE